MLQPNRCVLAFVIAGALAGRGNAQVPGTPLPIDPALVTGELENGLKYVVRKHSNPEGRAVIWVHMATGSLNETDRQRGIAHYTEHMAFNGSEHFPPGTLVPFFQSLGMTFGRDQNAFTNMNQTTYQLSLPDVKEETLGKGLTFFSDVVSKLSLTPAEIDAERQIILEERRRGLSARQRTGDVVAKRIAPGSLFGERLTIGLEETIKNVNQQDFKDYYGKWYAASNATVIVVADTDPAAVVNVIKAKFADLPKRPRPAPQPVNVTAYDKSFAIVATDPELRSEEIRISRLEPARPPTTMTWQYRSDLVLRLGEGAFNRRLSDKAAAGNTAYVSTRVSAGNESNALFEAGMTTRASNGKWREALEQSALELQRARAFGFTTREIDDGRKEMLSGAERAVETEATLPAGAIIGGINNAVATGEPVMSPKQRLDLLKELLPTIKVEEINKRFAMEFEPKAVAFTAVMPTGAGVPTEAELLDLGTKALAATPTQETEAVHATALITDLPKGGTIAASAEHAGSKVVSGWLGNNAAFHYRFMDQNKNQASIHISLIGGELLETADNRGITSAAQLAWSRAATKHLSSTDIRELMTGKKVNVRGGGFGGGGRGGRGGGAGGGGDSISLTISGSPEELETGFQLAYLLLTEPKIEEASFKQFQTTMREMLGEMNRNAQGVGQRAVAGVLYPDSEVRTRPPTPEQIDRLTLAAAQTWLEKLVKESPIEITIVGDLPQERAMELTTKYLGSLAAREKVTPKAFAELRKIARPKGPRTVEKEVETSTPNAFVYSGFYGVDEGDRDSVRALGMASRVLSTRMVKEVREEGQLVYSIGASSRAATTYPGFGVFSASAPTDPAKVSALVEKLTSMYEAFAKGGPTEDEMVVAKKQMANTLEEEMRTPAYWAGRLDKMTFRGGSLDDIMNTPAAYQAITAKQVQDTFARLYSKENAILVVVKPKLVEGAAGEGKAANEGLNVAPIR